MKQLDWKRSNEDLKSIPIPIEIYYQFVQYLKNIKLRIWKIENKDVQNKRNLMVVECFF